MLSQIEDRAVAANTETAPPAAVMLQLLFGKHITYSISAVARLGIADHMDEGPVDVDKLALEVGAEPAALYRVMRALAGVGVFEQVSERSFGLTAVSTLLKEDAPDVGVDRWGPREDAD
jgi:hypothetical protein